jgi:hypothetical protein
MREEQPKRDDHHKRAATISNTKIKMINKKLPVEDVNLQF